MMDDKLIYYSSWFFVSKSVNESLMTEVKIQPIQLSSKFNFHIFSYERG